MPRVRLLLFEGRDVWVDVVRLGAPGGPDEYGVRDEGDRLFTAGADDLAEAIECATGVHAGRAARLADEARQRLAS